MTSFYNLSIKMVLDGQPSLPWWLGILALHFPGSLVEEGRAECVWEWLLLSGLTPNTTQKSLLKSHLRVYPNYQLQGHDLHYSFGIILWSFLPGNHTFIWLVFLSLQVLVNVFSMENNSLVPLRPANKYRSLLLSFYVARYFLQNASFIWQG